MEMLTANVGSAPRRVMEGGTLYYVVNMRLIVPGVLRGSKGPLYYPEDEIALNADKWNGMPLVAPSHPQANGRYVSAKHPGAKQFHVGEVRNVVASGTLDAEGWFDSKKLLEVHAGLYSKLLSGEPIELSTGLYVDEDESPGVWNSVSYDSIARNHEPDHVAILANETGACSIADGCGIYVANCGCGGKCDTCAMVEDDEDDEEAEPSANAAVNQPKSAVTGRYKRLNAGIGKGPVHEAAQKGFVVISDYDRELASKGDSWVADPVKWERAQATATSSNYPDADYWPAVVHIYRGYGGTILEGDAMPLTEGERTGIVNYLVTNSSAWSGDDAKETLTRLGDKRLLSLKAQCELEKQHNTIVAAVKSNFGDMALNAMPAALAKAKKAKAEGADEEEEDDEEEATTPAEEEPAANAQTLAQWEATMPRAARGVWNAAKDMERRERGRVILKIVANRQGDDKAKRMKQLSKKTLPELLEILGDITANTAQEGDDGLSPIFEGAAGGGVLNAEPLEVLDLEAARANY